MRRFLHENGLSLALFALFLFSFGGQILTGQREYNHDRQDHHQPTAGLGKYLTSGHFIEATFENWESEFLQMGAYVLLTIWLRQKGSSESKKCHQTERVDIVLRDNPDAPWPVRRGGWVLKLYENSLSLALFALFALSFILHAIGGAEEYSQSQIEHGQSAVSVWEFLTTSQFWFQSFQNWQSEFLSVGAVVILSIYLRQKGSSQSKPVDSPHDETGD